MNCPGSFLLADDRGRCAFCGESYQLVAGIVPEHYPGGALNLTELHRDR